tara:strand:- start:1010 stop:1813 length:804 start_codon:yes stop_codon:yes gene_type:complete
LTIRLGVFDSGIGGFTVLQRVVERHGDLSFVYLGDLARVPYGSKSPTEIRLIASEVIEWLVCQDLSAVLVACNTTNSLALDIVERFAEVPVFGLIEAAAQMINTKRVGVLATPATAASKAYTSEILRAKPGIFVLEQPCPELVQLIEEGQINKKKIMTVANNYLKPLLEAHVNEIILGCSHYPLIASLLKELLPSHVRLIDPALGMAMNLDRLLGVGNSSMKNSLTFSNTRFCVTSDSSAFALKAMYWLENFPEVELISLRSKARVF